MVIRPSLVGDLTWVKAWHDSPYGRIVSEWQREGGRVTMKVSIPANTTAQIFVPTRDAGLVTESGTIAVKSTALRFERMESGAAVFSVGSGEYTFLSEP